MMCASSKSGCLSTTCEYNFCQLRLLKNVESFKRQGEHFFLLFLWLPFAAFLVTKMLVLYETAMGYCLFKMSDNARLEEADLYKEFETPERANKLYVAGVLYLYTTDNSS